MTAFKLLSAGVLAVAMLATPVMARDNYSARRHVAAEADSKISPAPGYIDRGAGISAPRVRALPAPPDGENCDVGDNPFIC
jgi:hypothetical protein